MGYLNLFLVLVCLTSCTKEDSIFPNHDLNSLLKDYSAEEIQAIHMDEQHITNLALFGKAPSPANKRIYVATVGAPGSSKSTILETYLAQNPDLAKLCVYVDPDQRALKFMTATYWQSLTSYQISQHTSYKECAQKAYAKWRAASNYIARNILNKAFEQGFSIAHGTTSTSTNPELLSSLYDKLHNKGYKVTLLLCMSDLTNRLQAVKQREEKQGFVQSTPEDFAAKEKAMLQNLPLYFAHADTIHVYWVERFDKGAIEVGTFTQEKGWLANPQNQKWLKKIKSAYNAQKSANMPAFESFVK